LSLALTFEANAEIEALGIAIPSELPFIELLAVTSEAQAVQMVVLAVQSLNNADAASLVLALSQNRALVTDDKRLKTIAEQTAPTLRLFSSSDLIQCWRELSMD
jgi:predicted nucleic acid-binding protein